MLFLHAKFSVKLLFDIKTANSTCNPDPLHLSEIRVSGQTCLLYKGFSLSLSRALTEQYHCVIDYPFFMLSFLMLCFILHAKQLPNCTEKQREAELKVDAIVRCSLPPLLLLFYEKKAILSFLLLSPPQSFVY